MTTRLKIFTLAAFSLLLAGSIHTKAQIVLSPSFSPDRDKSLVEIGRIGQDAESNSEHTHITSGYFLYAKIFPDRIVYTITCESRDNARAVMEIALGTTFDGLKASLDTMLDWLHSTTSGESIGFIDIEGRQFQLVREIFGFRVLELSGNASINGSCVFTGQQLAKAKYKLNKNAARKIQARIASLGLTDSPSAEEFRDSSCR